MDDKTPTSDRADAPREARAWVARLKSGNATRGDVAQFTAWRRAEVENETAYRETLRLWETLGSALEGSPETARRARTSRPSLSRRAVIGGGAGLSAAIVAGVLLPGVGSQPAGATVLTTRKGERRRIELGDGIRVELNTDSRLLSWRQDDRPRLELDRGEALIDVALPGGLRVTAQDTEIRADRARFLVRCDGDGTRVLCLDGGVDVRAAGQDYRLLPEAELSVADGVARLASNVLVADATAWRKGVFVFNGRPAGEVVSELNRYRAGRVFLPSARAETPISGVIYLDRADLAVDHVARSLGMTAVRLPGGYVVLRD